MASWTTPKTYSGNTGLSASELNTYQRDDLTWLKDALATHGISSDSTIGTLLTARKGASLYVATWSVADTTDVAIQFADADASWDDANFHTDLTPARAHIPVDGTYGIIGYLSFEGDPSGRREGWIEVNLADTHFRSRIPAASGAATAFNIVGELELSKGDYIILRARQNSGSSLDVAARLTIRLIASA